MDRRRFFVGMSGLLAAAMLAAGGGMAAAPSPLSKSRGDWKRLLPIERYRILFDEGTEPPFSSPLNAEKRDGTFICAACFLPLFDTPHKFDSGTGWPSFWATLPNAVATRADFKLVAPRTEYHCARCGGHQGHVFDDGPRPSGLRYCNNGLALEFIPAGQALPALRT